jgi:hypothetical protein
MRRAQRTERTISLARAVRSLQPRLPRAQLQEHSVNNELSELLWVGLYAGQQSEPALDS